MESRTSHARSRTPHGQMIRTDKRERRQQASKCEARTPSILGPMDVLDENTVPLAGVAFAHKALAADQGQATAGPWATSWIELATTHEEAALSLPDMEWFVSWKRVLRQLSKQQRSLHKNLHRIGAQGHRCMIAS
eukprot:2876630-Amphidinium_carterae.1